MIDYAKKIKEYRENKNSDEDLNKKSRSIFAKTIAQVYNEN